MTKMYSHYLKLSLKIKTSSQMTQFENPNFIPKL